MRSKQDILESHGANAESRGYYLCPDQDMLDSLIDGLAANEERYGYGSCPCRMSSGIKAYDSDIVCPCEYRDADVDEFGMCYCSLYVSKEVHNDPSKMRPIPERRPVEAQDAAMEARGRSDADVGDEEMPAEEQEEPGRKAASLQGVCLKNTVPLWRCTVCGYLAARELPPPVCPICKAKAERFERFSLG